MRLIALLLLIICLASPSYAQLTGDDTSPGDSCSGFPDGATRITADADSDGASVVLICDGSTWNAMTSGSGGSMTAATIVSARGSTGNSFTNGEGFYTWNYSSGTDITSCITDSDTTVNCIDPADDICAIELSDTSVINSITVYSYEPDDTPWTLDYILYSHDGSHWTHLNGPYDNEQVNTEAATSIGVVAKYIGVADQGVSSECREIEVDAYELGGLGGGGGGGGGSSLWSENGANIYYSSGDVGIGKTNPSVALDVVGDINYTGVLVDVSDIRMKYDVRPLRSPLAKMTSLNGFSFKMKNDESKSVEFGVSAQDVQKVFPELVHQVDERGTLGVSYNGLIAPMIEAMKEQQAQIEVLQAEIKTLKLQTEGK